MSTFRVNNLMSLETGKIVNVDDIAVEQRDLRIAVVGDSLSTENALHNSSWPVKFGEYLNGSGIPCRVFNYSVNGITFNRVLTETLYGELTALEALVESAPDIVYVALGFNDTTNRAEDRTVTQVSNDAEAVFNYLRTNLPNAKIVWLNIVSHDQNNASLGSLENKDVIPYFYNFRTTGNFPNTYSMEVIGDPISSFREEGYSRWAAVTPNISSLSTVDETLEVDYFKIARLGCVGWDSLHPTDMGTLFFSAYVVKGSSNSAALSEYFGNIGEKLYDTWYDPDWFFDQAMTWNGDGYTFSADGNVDHVRNLMCDTSRINPDVWFYPHKASIALNEVVEANGIFTIMVQNASSGRGLYPSNELNEKNDSIGTTNARGDVVASAPGPLAEGTHTLYYTIGNEHYGPFEFDVEGYITYRDKVQVLPLKNGWVADPNYSDGNIYIRRDINGFVHIEGTANGTNATNPVMFSVPEGFRPGWETGALVAMDGSAEPVLVSATNGDVQAPGGWDAPGAQSLVFLDSIKYRARG